MKHDGLFCKNTHVNKNKLDCDPRCRSGTGLRLLSRPFIFSLMLPAKLPESIAVKCIKLKVSPTAGGIGGNDTATFMFLIRKWTLFLKSKRDFG